MPSVELSDRVLSLGATERHALIKAYVARRLTPRNQRGNARNWNLPHGLIPTDVYNLIHHMGYSEIVSTTRDQLEAWLVGHPEYDPRLNLEPHIVTLLPAVTPPPPAGQFTLDAQLLQSLVAAEVQRVVQGMKGEIELHVRRETQAAVSRESERAASTLMHSMAATLESTVALEVQRQLEEFTR